MGKKVGAWRVHLGPLHGVNVRFFHSFERPCLTLLLHWRFR
jgi:hypothetical protein